MFRLTLLMILTSSLMLGSINFDKDYNKALKNSKEINKPIFVMVSSPTCPECNYMKKNIFTQKEVYQYINDNFVSVNLDVKDKNIPEQMKFWGIPRFYFSKDGENVYQKKMGGMKKEAFIDLVKKASL